MALKIMKMGATAQEAMIRKRRGFEDVGFIVPPKAPNTCGMVYYSASAQTCFQDEAGLVPVLDDGNFHPLRRMNGIGLNGSDLIIKSYQTAPANPPMMYVGFGYMSIIAVQVDCYAESAALQNLFSNRSNITMMLKSFGAELPSLTNFRDIPVIGFTAGNEDVFKFGIGTGHWAAPKGHAASNMWEWQGNAAAVLRWKDTPLIPAGDNILELGAFDRFGSVPDVYVGDLSSVYRQSRAALRMNIARDFVNSEVEAIGRMGRNLGGEQRTSSAAGVMKFEAGATLSALAISIGNTAMTAQNRAAAIAWLSL